MISGSYSALSALRAFGTKTHSNANNVANSNTDGFKKTRVTLAETEPQGVKANVDKVNTPGPSVYQETNNGSELVELSNVDLAEELTDSNMNTRFYQANLKTIQTVDEMTESLLDIKA